MASSDQNEKPIKERLQESMEILGKIRELGIPPTDPGYKALSTKFSEWVKSGEPWSGHVDFELWNRRAQVILPRKKGTPAKCNLLQYKF